MSDTPPRHPMRTARKHRIERTRSGFELPIPIRRAKQLLDPVENARAALRLLRCRSRK